MDPIAVAACGAGAAILFFGEGVPTASVRARERLDHRRARLERFGGATFVALGVIAAGARVFGLLKLRTVVAVLSLTAAFGAWITNVAIFLEARQVCGSHASRFGSHRHLT